MEILDEEGRLFGVVNVVDALVVLLALAVLVAGVALVTGGGGGGTGAPTPTPTGTPTPQGQPAVEHATLDLGTHPLSVASLVTTGEATLGPANATITDVYRSPRGGGAELVVKVAVEGRTTPDGFRVGDQYLRYGVGFTLAAPEYQLGGQVVRLGGGEQVRTRTVDASVQANLSTAVADAIEVGDRQRIANETVASVTDVETLDSGADWRLVRVTVSAEARPVDEQYVYAGRPVRIGAPFGFETREYAFSGTVVEVTTPP